MAAIITNGNIKLFISFAPGTGSTALEQHLRTNTHNFPKKGLNISYFPKEEFGEGGVISRHITYSEYISISKNVCDFNATGIRNPFSYYFAEYQRIKSKWSNLLDDPNSWVFKLESKSTLDLIIAYKKLQSFDEWFYYILQEAQEKGYLIINEDHLALTSHTIKIEELDIQFSKLITDIFSVENILEEIGSFPIVNKTNYQEMYHNQISPKTKELALNLFGHYLHKYEYQY